MMYQYARARAMFSTWKRPVPVPIPDISILAVCLLVAEGGSEVAGK
jgi:hypothetical protein